MAPVAALGLPSTLCFPPAVGLPSKCRKRRWIAPRGERGPASCPNSVCPHRIIDFGLLATEGTSGRRKILFSPAFSFIIGALPHLLGNELAAASEFADMPALRGKDYGKSKMRYPDYTETQSGLQYKDLRIGDGPTPKAGETVVVDWDGYTIGYYGRIFEARNKTKGGSFEGSEKDFFKFKIGTNQVIPAFEEAVAGMAPGGIRSVAGS